MIFVTVGEQLPFDRLINAVDKWAIDSDEIVFAQIGKTELKPKHLKYKNFLSPEEFMAKVEEAQCIIAHAGMGTIITAVELNKSLIVMPRKASLGEHRNDHQSATAKHFQEMDMLSLAVNEIDLIRQLNNLSQIPRKQIKPQNIASSTRLLKTIEEFIDLDCYNPMKIQILGSRGIPAQHGGFETFAENFAIYLKNNGWQVIIYCQENGSGQVYEDEWCGIQRVHIPISQEGATGTIVFDWKSTLCAVKNKIPVLTLGYNTALFCCLYRLKGLINVINMDGVEWKRGKWNIYQRSWLYFNEKLGAWLGNHLIADHPEIKKHLQWFCPSKKMNVIPYCADIIRKADVQLLSPFNLESGRYTILIARPEKENSILEVVKAYSKKSRGIPLVILGDYAPQLNSYHKEVFGVAGNDVKFVGAIYDKKIVQALRFHARFCIHGHTVGGTNPSLVEALGAGSAILAHGNKFNRWVAGDGARYFLSIEECAKEIDILLKDNSLIAKMKKHSIQQISRKFTCDKIFKAYESLLIEKFEFS